MAQGEKTKLLWQDPVYRERMSKAHKGNIPTNLDTLIKLSRSTNGHREKQLGRPAWNKGVKMPEISGSNHYAWKPDRSLLKDDHKDRAGQLHREWSMCVKSRDGWRCRIANGDCSGRMEAHHILGWRSHPELRYQVNNGITLCHNHHPRKREEEQRLSPYFQSLVDKAN